MTKLRADEYAIIISAKLHALASAISCGTSNKQSFGAAMVRIAKLSDDYEVARVAEAKERVKTIRPSYAQQSGLGSLNQ
jgi:hypothetical protein